MKKTILALLLFSLFLQSCYSYSAMKVKKDEQLPPVQKQIIPNQTYKIIANNKSYTIKAVKWEGDSLLVQADSKKEITTKFSVKDITSVKKRSFSEARSNFLTFMIYGAIAIGVVFSLK